MGFRFHNFNTIYRNYFSRARLSSQSNKTYYYRSLNSQFQLHPSSLLTDQHYLKIPIRWHSGHSHDHHHHQPHQEFSGKEAENIFRLGLASDIGLAAGKALTGYLSGSTAIIADAAHSISDVSLISAAPEVVNQSLTHEHVHNHHHSGHHHGIDMDHPILALTMTIVSILVKEGLYWITKRAGERQGSGLMKANAWHHRADAVSSIVALIGVGGSILGVKFLDPLAGLVVSGMIFKVGMETGYLSVLELVDAAIPVEDLDPIRQTILNDEGVKGCHRLRGRRAGSSLYLDVHIVILHIYVFLQV